MTERTFDINEISQSQTGKLPDTIHIYAITFHGLEEIGELQIPMVGLEYVRDCALNCARALPWYDRVGHIIYHVVRQGQIVAKGNVK